MTKNKVTKPKKEKSSTTRDATKKPKAVTKKKVKFLSYGDGK